MEGWLETLKLPPLPLESIGMKNTSGASMGLGPSVNIIQKVRSVLGAFLLPLKAHR